MAAGNSGSEVLPSLRRNLVTYYDFEHPVPVLLYREIPHKTGVRAVLQQRRLLGSRGLKPEPHGENANDHHRNFEDWQTVPPGNSAPELTIIS